MTFADYLWPVALISSTWLGLCVTAYYKGRADGEKEMEAQLLTAWDLGVRQGRSQGQFEGICTRRIIDRKARQSRHILN